MGAGLGVVQVGHVLHLSQLLHHRFFPRFVGNSKGGDANAAAHVDVCFSGIIINQGTLAGNHFDGESGIGIGHIGFIDGFQIRHMLHLPQP